MEVTFGFLNICSFFPAWIFNIYSWIVSTALYGDDVLSVPATKAFSKSQAFYDFPCSFFCLFSCCQCRSNQSRNPLALLGVWSHTPGGSDQTTPSPAPKSAFAVQQPWRFPQNRRVPERRCWLLLWMKTSWLGVLLESCCKTPQRTEFDCF